MADRVLSAGEAGRAGSRAPGPPLGRALRLGSLCAAFTLAGLAVSREAAADDTLGVALNYGHTGDSALDRVGGLDAWFGPRLDLTLLTLTTELGGGIYGFGGSADANVYRVLAGGRLGVGAIVRPSVFGRIGVAHLRYDALGGRRSTTDLATELGVGLDFTLVPLVDFGVQGSYNAVHADVFEEPLDWFQAGVTVTLVMDG